MSRYLLIASLLASGLLTGCGSDSDTKTETEATLGATYTGVTTEGVINESTRADFQATAVELVKSLVAYNVVYNNYDGMVFPSTYDFDPDMELAQETPAVINSNCESSEEGATVTITGSDDSAEGLDTTTLNATFVFSDYCEDSGDFLDTSDTVFNGAVSYVEESSLVDNSDLWSFEYSDFEVTLFTEDYSSCRALGCEGIITSEVFSLDGYDVYTYDENQDKWSADINVRSDSITTAFSITEECSEALRGCESSIDIIGLDQNIYRYVGDRLGESGGINGSIFDQEHGSVMIQTDYIGSLCEDENGNSHLPQGEQIIIQDAANNRLTITADACGVYTSEIEADADPLGSYEV